MNAIASAPSVKVRHRRIMGGFAGFFTFLFLAVDLLTFGIIALNSPLITILPLVGIVVGVLWASWSPFGRRRATSIATPTPAASATPAPATVAAAPLPPPPSAPSPPQTAFGDEFTSSATPDPGT